MTSRLTKNTNKHNNVEDINNDLEDMPSQKKKHSCNDLNSNMPTITKINCFLKL